MLMKGNEISLKYQPQDIASGLKLELYSTTTNNLLSEVFQGFNIFVNNQKIYPAYYEGFSVKLGTWTNVVFDRQRLIKKPYPYSNCQNLDTFKSDLISEFQRYVFFIK